MVWSTSVSTDENVQTRVTPEVHIQDGENIYMSIALLNMQSKTANRYNTKCSTKVGQKQDV